MNTSETVGKLAEALCKAQATMKPAAMTGRNPHLKNVYATFNDVMDAARKPLVDNGLSYVQMITTPPGMDGFVGLTTRLMHISGEWLEDTVAFPVDPGSNRAVNAAQTAGSTITYMRRYALSAMLGIVADEDVDGNQPTSSKADNKPAGKAIPTNGNGQAAPPFANEGGKLNDDGPMLAATKKTLEQLGKDAYGPDWKTQRGVFEKHYSLLPGEDFTEKQAQKLIAGMEKRLEEAKVA